MQEREKMRGRERRKERKDKERGKRRGRCGGGHERATGTSTAGSSSYTCAGERGEGGAVDGRGSLHGAPQARGRSHRAGTEILLYSPQARRVHKWLPLRSPPCPACSLRSAGGRSRVRPSRWIDVVIISVCG